jgi:hypothetical protein
LSLAQAVLAYRSEYQVERSFGRLKGRPLSLTPHVQGVSLNQTIFCSGGEVAMICDCSSL